jgi:hypothetical protein
MSAAEELTAAVAERLAGSVYSMERTPDGFVVHADLTDEHVFRPHRDRAVRTTVQHHVQLDEPRRVMRITDVQVDVVGRAGAVPGTGMSVLGAGARAEHRTGRVREVSFRRTWDPSKPKGERVLEEARSDSHEVVRHIRDVAGALGWDERDGAAQRSGKIFGLAGGAIGLLTLVVLGVALLVR